jgi:hypothetical protein
VPRSRKIVFLFPSSASSDATAPLGAESGSLKVKAAC